MSDRFHKIEIEKLLKWILEEEKQGRILGIYKELFFKPGTNDPFKMMRYGKLLETPNPCILGAYRSSPPNSGSPRTRQLTAAQSFDRATNPVVAEVVEFVIDLLLD